MTPGLLRTGTLALLLILTMTLLITISSVAAGEGILPVFTPVPVYVGIFPVNTVDDSNDGECDAGHCSLREAIHRANTLSGSPKITFDIPGPGPHVIELWGELPPLASPGTTIDGFSEPDYIDTPVIVLWTESGFATPIGLEIAADNITVRGLSIVGFRDPGAIRSAGIEVSSGSGSLITHNYIGIDPSGAADGNLVGIYLRAEGQEIWSNVISGNETGIHISQGDQDIADNRIGTNPQGDASSPELHNVYGILITQSADGVIVGGLNPMYANVISGAEMPPCRMRLACPSTGITTT
jgi:CSLREA domain-containing protein